MQVRTNIYLPRKMINRLKHQASTRQSTMSDVVRDIIALDHARQETKWADGLLKLAHRAGRSGLGDLSQKHDEYLLDKK